MHELTADQVEQVSGGGGATGGVIGTVGALGGGIRVGSGGANNIVDAALQPLGGRVDPGGANNAL